MKKIGESELPTVHDIDTVLKQHTRNKRLVFIIIVIVVIVLGYLLIYFVYFF